MRVRNSNASANVVNNIPSPHQVAYAIVRLIFFKQCGNNEKLAAYPPIIGAYQTMLVCVIFMHNVAPTSRNIDAASKPS